MKSVSNPVLKAMIAELVTAKERDAVLSVCAMSLEKIPSHQTIGETLIDAHKELVQKVDAFFSSRPTRSVIQEGLQELERLSVVRLTTAFAPSEQAVTRWQKLCREALNMPCVLEITKDEGIAAGAVIDMNGRLFRSVLGDEMDNYV